MQEARADVKEQQTGMYSQDHDRIAHKTASYIEKNCSLNESMEKLRSNEYMEQPVMNVIETNNLLDQCERTVAT